MSASVVFEHKLCSDQTVLITTSGDAEKDQDFGAPESVGLTAGYREYPIPLTILDDTDKEELESFTLTATSDGINFSQASASLAIEPVPAQLAGSYYGTCMITQDSLVRCWGYNGYAFATGDSDEVGIDFGEADIFYRCDDENYPTLMNTVALEKGDTYCTSWGGTRTEFGADTNLDGILSDDEVTGGRNQCNTETLNRLTTEPERMDIPQLCALGGSMVLYGIDDNSNGQLDGTTLAEQIQSSQLGDFVFSKLQIGGYHGCMLTDANELRCWGSDSNGRVANGGNTIGDDAAELGNAIPAVALGDNLTVKDFDIGEGHTCAILSDDSLKCWGSGNSGRLGHGETTSIGDSSDELGNNMPSVDLGNDALGVRLTAVKVAAGYQHTCAILSDNSVKCWGDNGDHALGNDDPDGNDIGDDTNEMGDFLQAIYLGNDGIPVDIFAGYENTCVAFDNNRLKCWGNNGSGQGGQARSDDHIGDAGQDWQFSYCGNGNGPVVVSVTENTCNNGQGYTIEYFIDENDNGSVDNGEFYRTRGECTTSFDSNLISQLNQYALNDVECEGKGGFDWVAGVDVDNNGNFGNEMGDSLSFIDVKTSAPLKTLVIGYSAICALFEDHTLNCWGDSTEGTAGLDQEILWGDDVGETPLNAPEVDLGTDRYAVDIAGGGYQMCALLDNHDVKCWGYSEYGETGSLYLYDYSVGNGLDYDEDRPVQEMGDNLPVVEIF